MADINIVKVGLKYHRHSHEEGCVQDSQACPYIAKGDRCFHILLDDALSVINEQQAEIERLKALADNGNRKRHLSDYEKACLNNARVTYAVNQDAPFNEGVIQMTVLKTLLDLLDCTCLSDE